MSNRHRRTRIYAANYDIVQSYYKQQLNDLDKKIRFSRDNDVSVAVGTTKENKLNPKVTFLSTDSNINEDEYSKGITRSTREISVENDRYHNNYSNDFDQSFGKDSIGKEKSPLVAEEKITSYVSRHSKFTNDKIIGKISVADDVNASRRANITKARLLDLEEQIMSVTNKQDERDKRNKSLKKILYAVSNNDTLD